MLPIKRSYLLCLPLLLAPVACKKKEDNAYRGTSRPETVAPEAPAPPPPPPVFAIGDDFNRVDVPRHTERPTVDDLQPEFVVGPWSTVRGNASRSGLRDAPAIQQPRIQWRTEVGIMGYPNVIAEDGTAIYVSTQGREHDVPDEWDGVVALSPTDGRILWRYRTESDANGMTLHNGVLYVGTDGGYMHAVQASDGAPVWKRALGCAVYTAPAVDDTFVTIVRDGKVFRLFRATGVPERELASCRDSERSGISAQGDETVSFSSSDKLRLFEGVDRRWSTPVREHGEEYNAGWQPPVILQGLVIQADNGWPMRNDSTDEDASPFLKRAALIAWWRDNGERAWMIDLNGVDPDARHRASLLHSQSLPLVVHGSLYAVSALRPEITIYNASTGTPTGRIPLPDCRLRQFSSPVGTNDVGYLARHDGVVYQFDYATQRITWALSVGKVGVSGQRVTHAPSTTDGCTAAPVDGSAIFATPTIAADGSLYVGSGEGWVYALTDAAR